MNSELTLLGWTVALGLVQILIAAALSASSRGFGWAAGPRDGVAPPLGTLGGRLERAKANFLETFPLFAVAVLVVVAAGKSSPTTLLGAQIYFWARVAYVPAYALTVPLLRSVVWAVSLIGLLMVIVGMLR